MTENPESPESPNIVSTGWKMKELSLTQLEAVPEIVRELYLQMKLDQPVDAKQLQVAIKLYGGKYFIGPKARYTKSKKKTGPIASKIRQAFGPKPDH